MSRKKADKEQELDNMIEQNEQENADVKPQEESPEKEVQQQNEDTPENNTDMLLKQKDDEAVALRDQLQRLAAEFDNYKKRTAREKDKLYAASVVDVAAAFLPVLDNVELALKAAEGEGNEQGIREGVQLIHRQIQDTLSKLNIKPIDAVGEPFNPEIHEAVMHVEDDAYDENIIMEEFRKGYIYKDDAVIRHSVVKVAN